MSLAEAYSLRARLRPLALSRRVRSCGTLPISPQPAVKICEYEDGTRRAWWLGVSRCGRQHSCPVCAARVAAKRADELDRMMRGDACGRWQMLTLTLRHEHGEKLLELRKRLMKAWRVVRSTRAVREIFERRVTASVRALEVTHGQNGWHPHLHLLLRTEGWDRGEQETLLRVWCEVAGAELSRGVVWSTPLAWSDGRSRYLSKLGAEVAGVAKECKNGNRTAWQLASAALVGSGVEQALWIEYQEAMRGARILELDERAKALARVVECEKPVREWRADMFAEEFSALVKLESVWPEAMVAVLESACTVGPDPPGQVRVWIDDALEAEKARLSAAA